MDIISKNYIKHPSLWDSMKWIYFLAGVILALAAFGAGYLLKGMPTGHVAASPANETAQKDAETIDMRPDIISKDVGTIVVWSSENLSARKAGLVEFFSSRKIKGLNIRYNIEQKKLIAGLPELIAENIAFEGAKHYIAYTWNKDGMQQLYFDRELKAEGPYSGKADGSLTGMVIGGPAEKAQAEVQVFAEQLQTQQIDELE
jgi:hypothetical protein